MGDFDFRTPMERRPADEEMLQLAVPALAKVVTLETERALALT